MDGSKLHAPFGSVGRKLTQDLPYSRPQTPGQPTHVQLGWIGLGAMGYLIARNLANYRGDHLEKQPPLLVWNRSKDKSEKLLHELGEHKVAIAQSVVDLAKISDIILISLSGDDVVKSVYKDIAAALQVQPPTKRKIFVETSTVSRDRFLPPSDTESATHDEITRYIPAWQARLSISYTDLTALTQHFSSLYRRDRCSYICHPSLLPRILPNLWSTCYGRQCNPHNCPKW
jgi:hypothetical protein